MGVLIGFIVIAVVVVFVPLVVIGLIISIANGAAGN